MPQLRKRIAEALLGVLYGFLFVWALLSLLLIAGCANGVQMTEEEVKACRDSGCSAWTEAELEGLVKRAIAAGYRKGWTDATKQGGHDL